MNHERADAALFGDALSCEDLARAAFLPQQHGDTKFETALKIRAMAGAAKLPRW